MGKWGGRASILVVGEEEALLSTLQRFVERRGMADVFVAHGFEQARSILAGLHFDGVAIDVDLPFGEAPKLLVELSVTYPSTRRVGIGRASRRGLEALVEAGLADAVVAKPIDVGEFLEAMFPGRDLSMPAPQRALNAAMVGAPQFIIEQDSTPLPI